MKINLQPLVNQTDKTTYCCSGFMSTKLLEAGHHNEDHLRFKMCNCWEIKRTWRTIFGGQRLFDGRPLPTGDIRYGVLRLLRVERLWFTNADKNRALLSAVSQTTPFSGFSTQLTFIHSPVLLCMATQVSMGINSDSLELFPQLLKLRPVSSCHLKSSSYQTNKPRHQILEK